MPRSVAIVGAGLAGLSCARTLAAHGVETRLFDKGRAPGGRLATRRVEAEGRAFAFDHGAQYLTARGALFRATLEASGAQAWQADGWHVGVPRMSAIPRALAEGLEVALAREVVAVEGAAGAWMLRHAAPRRPGQKQADDTVEASGPFDAVVLAIPAPQAVPLLRGPAPHLARVVEMVRIAPCWTLMAAFPSRLALPDTLRPEGSPIGWAARDSSKPARDAATECWVMQGGPAWSREHLELRAEEAQAALLTAFAELAGGLPAPLHASAHRWRYALVEQALGAPCLWEPALGLGAAGDWCIAARAEAAVESGAALGAVIAGR
ncbi:NAD(P)/FAD-dependent oxidoreductase [Falsiroseomonas oryziterrae]|uniref:NAD(P)/FAD-dependent oxidoreductase n=1 Tax=Falsiroseomonas oryziterrae TaxID=2911368 RepID=UPI001F20B8D6|nr:NAD(P)-binding protein [Roseomonas sp. NPKOSM-4]